MFESWTIRVFKSFILGVLAWYTFFLYYHFIIGLGVYNFNLSYINLTIFICNSIFLEFIGHNVYFYCLESKQTFWCEKQANNIFLLLTYPLYFSSIHHSFCASWQISNFLWDERNYRVFFFIRTKVLLILAHLPISKIIFFIIKKFLELYITN